MNSFENPFSSPPPLNNSEQLPVENQGEVPKNSTDSVETWKKQVLTELNLQIEAPYIPENDFSSQLRELAHSNPYASRLLNSLGYPTSSEFTGKAPSPEKRDWSEAANGLLQIAGTQMVGDTATTETLENQESLMENLRERSNSLVKGAIGYQEGRYNPLSGYFTTIYFDESGEVVREPDKQDVNRWSKAVLYNEPGAGALRETRISPQQETDLLRGYFIGHLADNTLLEPSHWLKTIEELLPLLADTSNQTRRECALENAPLFAQVRTRTTDAEFQNKIDGTLWEFGLEWDEESETYIRLKKSEPINNSPQGAL